MREELSNVTKSDLAIDKSPKETLSNNPVFESMPQEFYWTCFPCETQEQQDMTYKFRLFDICRPKPVTKRQAVYLIYEAQALEDYEHLNINAGDKCLLNVPHGSFRIALKEHPQHKRYFKEYILKDWIISFQRRSKKVIKIIYLDLVDSLKELEDT